MVARGALSVDGAFDAAPTDEDEPLRLAGCRRFRPRGTVEAGTALGAAFVALARAVAIGKALDATAFDRVDERSRVGTASIFAVAHDAATVDAVAAFAAVHAGLAGESAEGPIAVAARRTRGVRGALWLTHALGQLAETVGRALPVFRTARRRLGARGRTSDADLAGVALRFEFTHVRAAIALEAGRTGAVVVGFALRRGTAARHAGRPRRALDRSRAAQTDACALEARKRLTRDAVVDRPARIAGRRLRGRTRADDGEQEDY